MGRVSVTAPAQAGFPSQRPRVVSPRRLHVGFDLGLYMGYAALTDEGRIHDSGVWNFDMSERMRKTDPGARWIRVGNDIGDWFKDLRAAGYLFTTVAYEIVHRHEGVLAAHVYGGMEAMLLAQLSRFGLTPERVEVADVKLIATGRGNARKEAVMVAARSKWGGIDIDAPRADNLCDALFIAEMNRRRTLGVVF